MPLPPFPKPTHGPAGSGLKRFVTVWDALEPLRRRSPHAAFDKYHQPNPSGKAIVKDVFDPQVTQARCITTNGGDNVHYSGERKNTVRETSFYQGFPPDFQFRGSVTEAMKCAGNAFSPSIAKVHFEIAAQTLEAFDHGMISADDDINDLYDCLCAKGIHIPEVSSPRLDLFSSPPVNVPALSYRYLPRLRPSAGAFHEDGTPRKRNALWSHKNDIKPPSELVQKYPLSFI